MRNRNAVFAIVFAIVLGATSLGHAGDAAWTCAGSTGVPDEADAANVKMTGAVVRYANQAPIGSATVRYNITATDGLMSGDSLKLKISFRDTSGGERVEVFIREVDLDGSRLGTTIVSFDSDELESEGGFRSVTQKIEGMKLDFEDNAYCLEVILSKSSQGGRGAAFLGASLSATE